MKKSNYINRILTTALSIAMLLQTMFFAGTSAVSAAPADVKTLGSWYVDEPLNVDRGGYPNIELTGVSYNANAIHTLSYQVKALPLADDAAVTGSVGMYGEAVASFGRYFPGQGFEGAYYKEGGAVKPKFDVKTDNLKAVNVWYTVETEWSEKIGERYMKYSIKNENGETVYAESEKIEGLWRDNWDAWDTECNDSFLSTVINPWNQTNTTIQIKNVVITENPIYGEVFKYEFNSDFDYDNRWLRIEGETKIVTEETTQNGVLQIPNGAWPAVKINADSGYYEFSYKVKANEACSGNLTVYDYSSNMNFGRYYAGKNIAVGVKDPDDVAENSGYLTSAKNVWYTVKLAFSANSGEEYARYIVLDAEGNEVYKKTYHEIKKSDSGAFGSEIVFWNQDGGACYYIDDVTLTQLKEPAITAEPRVLVDESFDSGIYESTIWNVASKVTIDNGMLKFPSGAYIYFNLPDKAKDKTYRITYDVMSDEITDEEKLGSLLMYGENNSATDNSNSNGMSMFNVKNGLYHAFEADLQNRIPKYTVGKGKVRAGKWYTAEIEFSESGGNNESGFIRMNLIDKETGRAMGDGFEVDLGYAGDQPNKTQYCIWSAGDHIGGDEFKNPDFYIDNFKVEELDMVYKRAVMKDLAGKDVTGCTDVTPLLSSIELLFSAPVDTQSAENVISLKKASGEAVEFTGRNDGNKYILDLTSVLEENTSYVLTVAKEVKAAESDLTLTEASTVSFSTGEAQTTANIVNITPEKLAPGTAKITADIVAYNSGGEALGMVVIAAFYNDDRLVDTQIQDLTVGAQEKKEQKIEFNVPDSQITSSKLFIWNSLDKLLPYDEARFIPYSAE